MTQMHLNSVAVCHIHQDLLDEVDLTKLMREFVSFTDSRVHVVWSHVNVTQSDTHFDCMSQFLEHNYLFIY